MSSCKYIRKKKTRVCVGSLQDLISIQSRNIETPLFNTVDFDENFDPIEINPEVYAMFESVNGVTYFDGVSTEIAVTDYIYIMYNEDVTSENWILFDNKRFDILDVVDFERRKDFMKLVCVDKGLVSREGSKI